MDFRNRVGPASEEIYRSLKRLTALSIEITSYREIGKEIEVLTTAFAILDSVCSQGGKAEARLSRQAYDAFVLGQPALGELELETDWHHCLDLTESEIASTEQLVVRECIEGAAYLCAERRDRNPTKPSKEIEAIFLQLELKRPRLGSL